MAKKQALKQAKKSVIDFEKLAAKQGESVSKELDVKKPNHVATQAENLNAWGVQEMSHKDILIPKILPMQLTSKAVIAEEASFGEFRDSLNNTLLGSIRDPLVIVPFLLQRTWAEYIIEKNKREYWRTTPIVSNPQAKNFNDDWSYEDVVDGKEVSRDRVMTFYVLLPKFGLAGLPFAVSFRRTSLRAGQKIATQFTTNMEAGKVPPAMTMVLSGTKVTGEDGAYIVLDAKVGAPSTQEEIAKAFHWYNIINKGGAKVDESDLKQVEVVEAELSEPSF